jgi:hypothetical protein
MENKFYGMSKRMLKDIQLRLLNELTNLRSDAKHHRYRLEETRSLLVEKQFEIEMLQDAITRETVVPFPQKQKDLALGKRARLSAAGVSLSHIG